MAAFEVSTGALLPSTVTTGDRTAVVRNVNGTWTPYALDLGNFAAGFAPATGIALTSLSQGSASTNQALVWSGTAWVPTTLSAGTTYTGTAPISISGQGVVTVATATTGALGVVKPDGTTITITSGGVISSVGGGSGPTPQVTVYTTSGAISPNDTLSILNSTSALAMTVANPTANTQSMRIVRHDSSNGAHTVTLTLNGTTNTLRTLNSPNGGDALILAADSANGTWYEVSAFDPGLNVSNLTAGSALGGTELFAGNTGGVDYKYTASQFAAYTRGTSQRSATLSFGMGATVAAGTLYVDIPNAATINSLKYNVGSAGGSFTVGVTINGANVTGLTGISVTSATDNTATATAANTVSSSGGRIGFVFTSISGSPTDSVLTLAWTLA